jgi:hypothetical protein
VINERLGDPHPSLRNPDPLNKNEAWKSTQRSRLLAEYLKWGKRKGGRCTEDANAGGKIPRFRVGIFSLLISVFTASSEREKKQTDNLKKKKLFVRTRNGDADKQFVQRRESSSRAPQKRRKTKIK